MKCIAGVGSNFYTSKAETALRTFTNSFLRIRNLPCSPAGAGKEQNKSVLLYHKEGFKKSSHGKIPLGDTYPRIRFSKKSQQEFLNEKGGSTAPSGFPLLNRRRHVKKS